MTARELFEALEKAGRADEELCLYDEIENSWECINVYECGDSADGVLIKTDISSRWAEELASAKRRISEAYDVVERLEDRIFELGKDCDKLRSDLDLQKHWVKSLKSQRDELTAETERLNGMLGVRQTIIEDRNLEIIQLKAQLYDMIKKGETK